MCGHPVSVTLWVIDKVAHPIRIVHDLWSTCWVMLSTAILQWDAPMVFLPRLTNIKITKVRSLCSIQVNNFKQVIACLLFYLLKFYIPAFIILQIPFYLQIYLCLCFKILWYKFSSTIHVYKEYFWPTIQTSFHLLYLMFWNHIWPNL